MEAKTGPDERFYTPRSSARRGYSSMNSEDERFVSPRETARSASSDESEYITPRENAPVAHAPRSVTSPTKSSAAAYEDLAFRAGSKQYLNEPSYDAYDYKLQHCSGSMSEVRYAAPPADDYDLFSAARHNRFDSVVYMLDQGIPVSSRDAFGNTLLHIGCQNGLKRVVKLALRRGANINSQNNRGNTALHFCFAYGYGDSLGAYLISKGADTSIENDDGFLQQKVEKLWNMVCERPVATQEELQDARMDSGSRAASDDSDLEEEMMRVNAFDLEWRRQLHVGDNLDAQNVFGNWCPAQVLQVADGEVLVQFLNMHDQWRKWFQLDSGCLSPPDTKARNDSVPVRQAQQIEVRPGGGNSSLWKEAIAVRARGGTMLVRYAGRDQKFDQWIPFTPATVAPSGDHLQHRGRGGSLHQRQSVMDAPDVTHRRVIQTQNPRFAHYRDSLQTSLGLRIFDIEGDGNCLFRSVSHQIYGDDRHHALVRAACMDYMESEKEYFEPYVVGDMAAFMRYLRYKRRDGVWGDDPELQAMCELYDRPAEVFAYDPAHGYRKLRCFHENGALSRNRPPIRLSYYGGGHYDSLVGPGHEENLIREAPGQWEQRHIGYSHRINSRETRADVTGVERQVQTESDRERTEVEQLEQILMASRNEFDAMDKSLEDTLKLSLSEYDGEMAPAQAHRENEQIEEATRESEMAAIQAELLAKAKAESEEEQVKSAIQASLRNHPMVSDSDYDAQMSAAIQASLGDAGAAGSAPEAYDEQLRRVMELSAQEYAPAEALGAYADDSANTDEMDELQRAIQASLQQT